jgi:hypothetical protein
MSGRGGRPEKQMPLFIGNALENVSEQQRPLAAVLPLSSPLARLFKTENPLTFKG